MQLKQLEYGFRMPQIRPYECEQEYQLWCEVLLCALEDATYRARNSTYDQRKQLEGGYATAAREWFEESRRDPGSFRWICGLLGLDPVAVMERLRPQFVAADAGREKERAKYAELACASKGALRQYARRARARGETLHAIARVCGVSSRTIAGWTRAAK